MYLKKRYTVKIIKAYSMLYDSFVANNNLTMVLGQQAHLCSHCNW